MENKLRLPLTFEKGLFDYYEPSQVQPGFATELQNYVPEPNGMLRSRYAWENTTTDGLESVRQGRGMTHHAFDEDHRYLVAADQGVYTGRQHLQWSDGSGVNQIQRITFTPVPDSGDFTISSDDVDLGGPWTTNPITFVTDFAALAATIKTELATASGFAEADYDVSVSVNTSNELVLDIEFLGALAQTNYNLLTVDGTSLVPPFLTGSDVSFIVEQRNIVYQTQSLRMSFYWHGGHMFYPDDGSFTLSSSDPDLGGPWTTDPININHIPDHPVGSGADQTLRDRIQAKLEDILGVGNVDVVAEYGRRSQGGGGYGSDFFVGIRFKGIYAGQTFDALTVDDSAVVWYGAGGAQAGDLHFQIYNQPPSPQRQASEPLQPTYPQSQVPVRFGVPAIRQVQRVVLSVYANGVWNNPTGGNFTLRFDNWTAAETTAAISWDANLVTLASNIAAALNALTNLPDAPPWDPSDVFQVECVDTPDEFGPSTALRAYITMPYNLDVPGTGTFPYLGYIWKALTLQGRNLTGDAYNYDALTAEEQQTGAIDGTVTLTIGTYGDTAPVAWDCVGADLEVAIEALHPDLLCVVEDLGVGDFNVVFDGYYNGLIPPLITVNTIDGGPSFRATTEDASTRGYKLWALEQVASADWEVVGEMTGSASNLVQGNLPASFASGASKLMIVTPGQLIAVWDGTTIASQTPFSSPRVCAFYKSRFWVGAGTDLWYSRLLNPDLWTDPATSANNTIPVGYNDGEPIECLLASEDILYIGKRNSMWQLTGSSSSSFALRRMTAGGCAPGRSMVETPFGLFAAGVDTVWRYTGGAWADIGGPIQNSYGMTGQYMTAAYCNGAVYICDEASGRIWVYYCASDAWGTEISDDENEGPVLVYAKADYLYAQPRLATTSSLVMFRQQPGATRGADANMGEAYAASTPEMWLGESLGQSSLRKLYLRVRQNDGDSTCPPLVIRCYVQGALKQTYEVDTRDELGVWKEMGLSLGGDGYGVRFEFSQDLAAGDVGVLDIEEAILEYDVSEPE